jgi:hypothetical protein
VCESLEVTAGPGDEHVTDDQAVGGHANTFR